MVKMHVILNTHIKERDKKIQFIFFLNTQYLRMIWYGLIFLIVTKKNQ